MVDAHETMDRHCREEGAEERKELLRVQGAVSQDLLPGRHNNITLDADGHRLCRARCAEFRGL